MPIREKRGFFVVERIAMMDYPFFPDIRRDGFAEGHLPLSGLQNVVMNWASPLTLGEKLDGRKAEVLLQDQLVSLRRIGRTNMSEVSKLSLNEPVGRHG